VIALFLESSKMFLENIYLEPYRDLHTTGASLTFVNVLGVSFEL
jgi:hypothetical protein